MRRAGRLVLALWRTFFGTDCTADGSCCAHYTDPTIQLSDRAVTAQEVNKDE